ncbi:E3 ubiquitin-protein ligase TRIM39 isoform X2 [Ictalurus punctatus]|uniref:E3 ubiquitin-protein ligase TRIM39 isoform X2 n=1 Tax=Ictalurus punctatus TaxID=7998 RepID=A0A9F7RLK8_ICTPU|nr:E3 ubiquitin-protein ligase TRIM39 isoform X2 [Ictalurus punctatus]XP_053538859.1 E3 ubiquitin-protein ligase TRIM39 isoform X2 [Ictalurus punctatus]
MDEYSSPQAKKARMATSHRSTDFAGESSSFLTEEQLQCSICLKVFTDPVTTPCGHSFCNSCLTQIWDTSQHYYCPYCKEKFTKRPKFKINITLREVSDCFKKKTVSDKSQVLCDICTGVKQEALKSCLDCAVAFCPSHLDLHNNIMKNKKHKVINEVRNLEKYICQEHKKPLEMFCRDDQKCVCRACTVTDHKNHNVIPLEEESEERKIRLGGKRTELQQMIQERLKKIQEINHSVELSKRNTDKEKSDSVEVFTALIRSIERSQAELLKVMEEKQKAAEKQAEGRIKKLQKQISVLTRRDTELEQLSHTDDHLHLLQIYPSLGIAPHTKNWTEIRNNTELSVHNVKTTLTQLQQTLNEKLSRMLNEKLKEMVPTELKTIQQYAVDVTLDPDTAHPLLILSDDEKQVTCGDTKQNRPDTPKRFYKYPIILGNQGFSSGRFYYEVQVSRKTMWSLGVARESVNRKGEVTLTPQDGFWTVALREGNEYKACDDNHISLSLREKPQKVGVFVNYDEGLVSFYDVEARSHIYSFTGQSFTEKLYPYFCPSNNDGGKNSAPLIISRV